MPFLTETPMWAARNGSFPNVEPVDSANRPGTLVIVFRQLLCLAIDALRDEQAPFPRALKARAALGHTAITTDCGLESTRYWRRAIGCPGFPRAVTLCWRTGTKEMSDNNS
jgi:hypothetical protein